MSSQPVTLPLRASAPAAGAKATLILVFAVGALLNVWMAANNSTGWGEDFNQYYAGCRLVGQGQLYNLEALGRIEAENGNVVPTGRLPVVIFGAKLISWMPYATARIVWLAASLAAFAIFALAWPGANRTLMAIGVAWSMPAGLLLVLGQDTPFWLACAAAGLLLMRRGHDRIAGIVLAACICKFQLTLGIAVLLLAQKRWRTLTACASVSTVLLAACFVLEGPQWPLRYIEASRFGGFSPGVGRMPNLNGLAYWLPWSGVVEIALAGALIWLLWKVCRRTGDLGLAGAGAVAAGLLLAHHCYANDCALLIPLLVLTLQLPALPRWLKLMAILELTPASTLLLTSEYPFAGQLLVAGYVVIVFLFLLYFRPDNRPAAGALE